MCLGRVDRASGRVKQPRLVLAAVITAAVVPGRAVHAQTADSATKVRAVAAGTGDSLFLRARKMVLEGNAAAGRALVDSALAATTSGSADYATALYWHGALSATAADAERDYRRVIIEYPFSAHSGDALLALAQLEMARGDRDPAIDHLQRFLLQRPNDPDRIRAGIWLGRLLLDENQLPKGCAVLLRTRASLGDSAIETRNQVDYYANRCAGVDTTQPAPRPQPVQAPARSQKSDSSPPGRRAPAKDTARMDTARHVPTRRDSTHRATSRPDSVRPPGKSKATPPLDSSRRPASPKVAAPPNAKAEAAGRFTVQVAAYDTKQAAEQLVAQLSGRGISARVVESRTAPFRVRIGHYASDAAAAAAARDLKGKGIVGFVTTTDNESASATGHP
jgi:cell division septation protein DedD